mmetsp:Transcript_9062/g.7979  ORF Transcript_9062/g.7979 Transcript_9062/m.7979 type:complete len:106 (+) Transcript_9062:830-1147(+)
MHVPLPISNRMNRKLNLFLSELNIPPKPIPTDDNEKLFDQLREKVLKMFSLQKHLKKKELEKKKFEEALEEKKQLAAHTPVKDEDPHGHPQHPHPHPHAHPHPHQ